MILDDINRYDGAAAYLAQAVAAPSDADRRLAGRKLRMAHDGVLPNRAAGGRQAAGNPQPRAHVSPWPTRELVVLCTSKCAVAAGDTTSD